MFKMLISILVVLMTFNYYSFATDETTVVPYRISGFTQTKEFYGYSLNNVIVLNDDSMWRVMNPTDTELKKLKTWETGDEIQIAVVVLSRSMDTVLRNKTKQTYVVVKNGAYGKPSIEKSLLISEVDIENGRVKLSNNMEIEF